MRIGRRTPRSQSFDYRIWGMLKQHAFLSPLRADPETKKYYHGEYAYIQSDYVC